MRITVHYRNYLFVRDQDPIVDAMRTVVKSEEKLKNSMAHEITGVATQTFDNWFNGTTRKPQNATVSQAMGALGYVRRDSMRRDGTVEVGFVKARSLDYEKEIEKQADWILKYGNSKKKKKKIRRNGGYRGKKVAGSS